MKQNITKIVITLIFFIGAYIINIHWLKVALFLISYLVIGYEIFLEAKENIKNKEIFGEEFLMTLASLGAFIMGNYPEAIAIMLFFQVGEMFEEYAEEKSKKSVESLMKLKPDYANVKENDIVIEKSPEQVEIGDIIVVKPGEKIPLDGIIVKGEALIDTSAITGESVPRKISVNDEIYSGSINTNSILEIKVTKKFEESTVSKILDLVENATEKKAHTEKFITKFAKIYTPAVILVAITMAIIPPLVLKQEFLDWLYRALEFLVVSCPCALVVSVPLSFFGGIGGASKNGILIKGSNYLELLSKLDTVVFDKTGTLTKGIFQVQSIEPEEKKQELLEIAAHLENYSNHPIANSIKGAYGKNIDKTRISDFEEISGNGIKAKIDGKQLYLGNSKLMGKIGVNVQEKETIGTVVYMASEKQYIGKIVIADEIKEDSKEACLTLKKYGIKQLVMLTGDRKEVGEKVGEKLGIDKVYTELLPTDKANKLEELLKNKRGNIAFVGDGINDAPVIAMADVGIAMGAYGADAAIEAADAVIMTDEPSKICTAIKVAKKTMKIAKENIIVAILVKFAVLILSILGISTMWQAVFADVGVTVLATLNSLRTLRK